MRWNDNGQLLAVCGPNAGRPVIPADHPDAACEHERRAAAHDAAGQDICAGVERQLAAVARRWPIHCQRCGCVSSTVRRDHDNVARCATCYRDEYPR
jgi:hypothetical protein